MPLSLIAKEIKFPIIAFGHPMQFFQVFCEEGDLKI